MAQDKGPKLEPDVSELLLCSDEHFMCESYIFEPGPQEKALGRLYVVGEAESRGGIGKELFDIVTQALQREYYREPSRGVLASFESALHQANIVLHDAAEEGVRDWMGYFHSLVAVLANNNLHISAAGDAAAFLVRSNKATLISGDLSYSPITNPLRTFSQVASGDVHARDVLYIGTKALPELFRPEDLARFAIDHAASTISTRLQQLYLDQNAALPLAALVISVLPRHINLASRPAPTTDAYNQPRRRDTALPLAPRKPITIHKTVMHALAAILIRAVVIAWNWLKTDAWPWLVKGSRHSGRVLAKVSVATGRNVQSLTKRWPSKSTSETAEAATPRQKFQIPPVKSLPKHVWYLIKSFFKTLPKTSKLFAALTVILAVILVVSLFILKGRRAEDAQIQRASEILHDAQTKESAAENALIYNNRDQADTFIGEAAAKAKDLAATNLYRQELADLEKKIASVNDRLQKVTRASTNAVKVVGDMAALFNAEPPTQLSFVNDALYTFNPKTNEVIKMDTSGNSSVVSSKTVDIGFLHLATVQTADKSVIYSTNTPGVAIFDTVNSSLANQQITLPGKTPEITSLAVFGSRLYILDATQNQIFNFNKNLRGYNGGNPWITDTAFPANTVKSITIDGNIYTLHADGTVRKLFKGAPVDFALETVEPSLATATKIMTSDAMRNIYILDQSTKRVVIFDKKGHLISQVLLDTATNLSDIAISPDENMLYALNDTQVLSVPLAPQ